MTKEYIKAEFIREAIKYGEFTSIGEHKKVNKIHKKLQTLYNYAKSQGQIELFSELLDDCNENVRLWAAVFTLKVFPIRAEEVLLNLTSLQTITSLTAKMTLELWKKGDLNLL